MWCCDKECRSSYCAFQGQKLHYTPLGTIPPLSIPEDGGFKGSVPLLQFSAASYFCNDFEISVKVEVLRVGDLAGSSMVSFRTQEGSAKAGVDYDAVAGRLHFEPGERKKDIDIPIGSYNDDFWNPTLEFRVLLLPEDLAGGTLDSILHETIVKKMDCSPFPNEAWRGATGHLREEEFMSLLFAMCRNLWKIRHVRKGSVLCMTADFVKNLWHFLNMFLYVYFINHLIRWDGNLYFINDREMSLITYSSLILLFVLVFHILDWYKLNAKVASSCRTFLQAALVQKYLNYSISVRAGVTDGEVMTAIDIDAPLVVNHAFMGLQRLIKKWNQILFMILFKLVSPIVFDTKFDMMMLVPLSVLPLIFKLFLSFREPIFRKALLDEHTEKAAVTDTVDVLTDSTDLIIDYDRRTFAKELFEARLEKFNHASANSLKVLLNTKYIASWLQGIVLAAYIYIGGKSALNGTLSVGMLVANLRILDTCGRINRELFDTVVEIQRTYPSMRSIFVLLNLRTDVEERLRMQRMCLQTFWGKPSDERILEDGIPIRIELYKNFTFSDDPALSSALIERLNFEGQLQIHQGQIVALVGTGGSGKTTFLRLVGGTVLPDMDKLGNRLGVCIPSHLRSVTVSSQAIFYGGTLLEEITFGCASGDPEGKARDRERALALCTELGIVEKALKYFDVVENWSLTFSEAETKIVNIARALFFNPEIICLHRPLEKLDITQMPHVVEVLHLHIKKRGLALDVDDEKRRRLRTIFLTSNNPLAVMEAHCIYRVSTKKGITQVTHGMADKMLKKYKKVEEQALVDFRTVGEDRCDQSQHLAQQASQLMGESDSDSDVSMDHVKNVVPVRRRQQTVVTI